VITRLTIDADYMAVRKIKTQINPAIIVMPATLRSNKEFIRAVCGGVNSNNDSFRETDEDDDSCNDSRDIAQDEETVAGGSQAGDRREGEKMSIRYMPGSEVTIAKAAHQISLISLLGMPSGLSPRERLSSLSHVIDPDCEAAFRSVGGLLRFLLKEHILNSLEHSDDPICLNEIKMANFADVLHMSRGTMRALQVFQLDVHPLSHGSGKAKEGLSLFGVLSKTRSAVGSRLLRSWLACPSTDVAIIHERQAFVKLLRSPTHDAVFTSLIDALRSIKNVPNILARLRNISASVADWQSLDKSARAFLAIIETLRTLRSIPELQGSCVFKRLALVDESGLRDTVLWISNVLDFPESKIAGRLVIADGFSDDIDSIRACYAGLDEFLTSVGVQELDRIVRETPLRIPRLHLCYLPQVGYLCLLNEEFLLSAGGCQELLSAAGFEFMFASPNVGSYFKNEKCYELDKELGVRQCLNQCGDTGDALKYYFI
jgi:DNA mismatch repair protein MSH5